MGPTAVGKTELTLRLAEEIHAEIINVDSIQIYRMLDIGSAKPSRQDMARIRHHLVDIRNPDEPFDAAGFARAARLAMQRIRERGRAVILSGGTGLYLNALLQGLAPCSGAHPALRLMLRRFLDTYGPEYLHALLEQHDPEAASRLHVNDTFRVVRALEVIFSTGMTMSAWHAMHREALRDREMPSIRVALIRPRCELYSRIDGRVDMMMEQGFVQEVRTILEKGFSPELKPLQSLGYRHIIRLLDGRADLPETIETMKRDTRRYAKRQLTWFRGQPGIQWFHPDRLLESGRIWPLIAGRCAAL
jgi:tRNA dimethylallyltransferase